VEPSRGKADEQTEEVLEKDNPARTGRLNDVMG